VPLELMLMQKQIDQGLSTTQAPDFLSRCIEVLTGLVQPFSFFTLQVVFEGLPSLKIMAFTRFNILDPKLYDAPFTFYAENITAGGFHSDVTMETE
jgi:hypothetical protein